MKKTREEFALVISHISGVIHVRTFPNYYGAVLRALTEAKIEVSVGVAEDDDFFGDCRSIWIEPPHDDEEPMWIDEILKALNSRGIWAIGYEGCIAPPEHPTVVRYQKVNSVKTCATYGLLFLVEYGYHDGAWFFGEPQALLVVAELLAEAEYVGESRVGEAGVESIVVVDAPALVDQVVAQLRERRIHVEREHFIPERREIEPETE